MFRRDHSLTVALCVSLIAHAGTVCVLVGRLLDRPALPQLSVLPAKSAIESTSPIFLARPVPPADLLFGDAKGSGEGANSSPGDRALVGTDAGQVQAFLSRDPVGAGQVGEDPTMSVLPQSASSGASSPHVPKPRSLQPAPTDPIPAFGVQIVSTAALPRVRRETPTVPQPPDDVEIAEQAPQPNEEVGAPSSAAPAADAAIMSDSESDPFAHGSSIEFHDGRVDVRFGRKVKTVRPRLSLAAKYDLLAMQYPRMVVRMHIESSGEVRKVEIIKSTGSDSADQEVKVALYQWWIEPPKNPHGVALADVVEFPIVWH